MSSPLRTVSLNGVALSLNWRPGEVNPIGGLHELTAGLTAMPDLWPEFRTSRLTAVRVCGTKLPPGQRNALDAILVRLKRFCHLAATPGRPRGHATRRSGPRRRPGRFLAYARRPFSAGRAFNPFCQLRAYAQKYSHLYIVMLIALMPQLIALILILILLLLQLVRNIK